MGNPYDLSAQRPARSKGIADYIDALIKARLRPLELEIRALTVATNNQRADLDTLAQDVDELHNRLHERELGE